MAVHQLTGLEFITRLLVGGLLGVAIGFERQWRLRVAGLHTCALVATGATLFALIAPLFGVEPIDRTLANIVTGVGFLAGGVILREGTSVRGLNTAATLWATAAVGALAGLGAALYAALGALAIVTLNICLTPVAASLESKARGTREANYRLTIRCEVDAERVIRAAVLDAVNASRSLALRSFMIAPGPPREVEITVELVQMRRDDRVINRLVDAISSLAGITSAVWKIDEDLLDTAG
jgi:putative Mg2+ transporter-C (MgtC) family protein